MKNTMKRLLMSLLVLVMLCGAVMPAAMAAEKVVSNAASTSLYAGGSDTLVVTRNGVIQSNSLYKWKSSKSSVVKVTSKGVITGMKPGSATITATRKSNKKDKCSIKVTVKRNKVDNIHYKPSPSIASYKSGAISLKSVEIVSPSKVVVEYYVAFNFPSRWKVAKITSVQDAVNLYNRSTGEFVKTIVGGYYQTTSKKISGFKSRKGQFVQTIKVTYSGSQVHCANIRLADYYVFDSSNAKAMYKYYK